MMDDDAYLSTRGDLDRLVRIMDSHENCAIVATNVIDKFGNVAIQFKDLNIGHPSVEDLQKKGVFQYIDFSGAVTLFRKSCVEQVGFYDESLFIYWNEADLALKMIALGYEVLYDSYTTPVHLASMTNRIHCRNHFYYIRNGNRIINEHLGIRERLVLIPLRTVVYSVKYLRECNYRAIWKLTKNAIVSFYGIFFGKRIEYKSEYDHLRVRSIYARFFWRDLYFQIFKV